MKGEKKSIHFPSPTKPACQFSKLSQSVAPPQCLANTLLAVHLIPSHTHLSIVWPGNLIPRLSHSQFSLLPCWVAKYCWSKASSSGLPTPCARLGSLACPLLSWLFRWPLLPYLTSHTHMSRLSGDNLILTIKTVKSVGSKSIPNSFLSHPVSFFLLPVPGLPLNTCLNLVLPNVWSSDPSNTWLYWFPFFLFWCWALNPGPHECKASILPPSLIVMILCFLYFCLSYSS
jgi:hypothetical protein